MARWHWNRSGASIDSLYELTPVVDEIVAAGQAYYPDWKDVPPPTTTLARVVAELGLVPFSTRREEEDVRFALGTVIATGMEDLGTGQKRRRADRRSSENPAADRKELDGCVCWLGERR